MKCSVMLKVNSQETVQHNSFKGVAEIYQHKMITESQGYSRLMMETMMESLRKKNSFNSTKLAARVKRAAQSEKI
jgi:hypothetical protein